MADLNHQSTSQYQKLDHFKETFANCLWSLLIQAENQNILQWNKSEQNFHNDLMEDLLSSIEQPPEFSLGDYAFVPFKVAKRLKENPQKITQYFSDELNKLILGQNTPWLKEVVTKGAFLNIFINTQHMSTFLIPAILDHSYFDFFQKNQTQALTTMIEFSQPNTHKDLHVGHGRNICLGDSICRLYQYIGEKVIPVNYFGDEGAHVAKSLYAIKKILGDKSIDDVIDHQNKSQWLNERYAEAHQLLTESEKNKD